jgi:predicted nuclease of predicted toxin-antitoxin system
MKLLLDECLPRRLKSTLSGHECQTVPEAGFAGKKNGELLLLAEAGGFEVFVTIDRGIEYEHSLRKRNIAVILIRARSSRLADLLPHVPQMLQILPTIQIGALVQVGI